MSVCSVVSVMSLCFCFSVMSVCFCFSVMSVCFCHVCVPVFLSCLCVSVMSVCFCFSVMSVLLCFCHVCVFLCHVVVFLCFCHVCVFLCFCHVGVFPVFLSCLCVFCHVGVFLCFLSCLCAPSTLFFMSCVCRSLFLPCLCSFVLACQCVLAFFIFVLCFYVFGCRSYLLVFNAQPTGTVYLKAMSDARPEVVKLRSPPDTLSLSPPLHPFPAPASSRALLARCHAPSHVHAPSTYCRQLHWTGTRVPRTSVRTAMNARSGSNACFSEAGMQSECLARTALKFRRRNYALHADKHSIQLLSLAGVCGDVRQCTDVDVFLT